MTTKRWLAVCVGLASLAGGAAQAETYQIDQAHSSVQFSIRHLVGRSVGKFAEFSGTVVYDPKAPEAAAAHAVIKAASINTLNERRDQHLRAADFLAVEQYPEITFKSTKAQVQGDKLLVTGELTLRGVTRTIQMPVEVLGVGVNPMNQAPVAGFAAELVIKRSDYGVDTWVDKAGVLGDEVKVTLAIEAGAQPAK